MARTTQTNTGAALNHKAPRAPMVSMAPQPANQQHPKRYATAVMLSLFLGSLGFDRFYLGYTGLGVAKLLTFGGLGVWALVDCILILGGRLGPSDKSTLLEYPTDKKPMVVAVITVYIVSFFNLLLTSAFAGFLAYQAINNPDFFKEKDSSSHTTDVNVYDRLTVGMTKPEVDQAFDGSGYNAKTCTKRADHTGSFEECTYSRYSILDTSSIIDLTFKDGKLSEKSERDPYGETS
jgi:hypothetical protein